MSRISRPEIRLSFGVLLIVISVSWVGWNMGLLPQVEIVPLVLVLFGSWLLVLGAISSLREDTRFSTDPLKAGAAGLALITGGFFLLSFLGGGISVEVLAGLLIGLCGVSLVLMELRRSRL